MYFNKYIDWEKFWSNEVKIDPTLHMEGESILNFEKFKSDKSINLNIEECRLIDIGYGTFIMVFAFSEIGDSFVKYHVGVNKYKRIQSVYLNQK